MSGSMKKVDQQRFEMYVCLYCTLHGDLIKCLKHTEKMSAYIIVVVLCYDL